MKYTLFTWLIITANVLFAGNPHWDWAKQVGGAGYDNASSIVSDHNGKVYFSGTFDDTARFGTTVLIPEAGDAYVVSSDETGVFNWTKPFSGRNYQSITDITVDKDLNPIIGGSFSEELVFDSYTMVAEGKQDAFVACLSPNGDFNWWMQIKGKEDNVVEHVHIDDFGDIYAVGYFKGTLIVGNDSVLGQSVNNYDAFILKLSPLGEVLWLHSFGGRQYTNVFFHGLENTPDHQLLLCGNVLGFPIFQEGDTLQVGDKSNGFLGKMNTDGRFLWAKQTGEFSGEFANVGVDEFENIYVSGNFGYNSTHTAVLDTLTIESFGYYDDVVVAKFDKEAHIQWAKIGGSLLFQDRPLDVQVRKNGDVYIAGWFGGAQMNWQTDTLTSFGSSDIFLIKFNTDGEMIWAKQAGGDDINGGDEITAFDIDDDKIYCVGNYTKRCLFDTILIQNGKNGNAFIATLVEPEVTNIHLNPLQQLDVQLFPTLLKPSGRIHFNNMMSDNTYSISVVDINGRNLYQTDLLNKPFIDIQGWSKGMYFVSITSNNRFVVRSFIVE